MPATRFVRFPKAAGHTHIRKTHSGIFPEKNRLKNKPAGVLHRYGGPVDLMKQVLSWGMYISFNNDLTYPAWNRPHIDCLMACPWEQMLVETDCPYAPPYERENDRCESSDVRNVVRVIAKLRNVSEDFVADITYENAKRLYRIA